MSLLIVSVFVLFLLPLPSVSQIEIEEEIELAIFAEESLSPELAAWLEELRRSPIDLRSAEPADLRELPGLSDESARRVLYLIDSLGVDSLEQLLTSGLIGEETATSLRLFTRLERSEAKQEWQWEIRSRVTTDLQRGKGFRDSLRRIVGPSKADTVNLGPRHLSFPGGMSTRVLVTDGSHRFGLIVDRDPGEVFIYRDTLDFSYRGNERLDSLPADPVVRKGVGLFLSGFALFDLEVARLLIGDYSLSFGSGLLFGRPFSGRKGGSPTRDPLAGRSRIRPHTSKSESGYFRGLAASGTLDSLLPAAIDWTLFLSRRFHDGSIATGTDEGFSYSIDDAGDLSTRTDLRRDDRIEERTAGGRLALQFDRGTLGTTIYTTRTSPRSTSDLSIASSGVRSFSNVLAGLDADLEIGALRATAEIALGGNGWGTTTAIRAGSGRVAGVLAVRHFSDDFISPHAVSFAESPTRPDGETGLYAGFRVRPLDRVRLESYVDLYRQSSDDMAWPFPDLGTELMGRIRVRIERDVEYEVFLRTEVSETTRRIITETGREAYEKIPEQATTGRVGLKWNDPGSETTLRVRLEERRVSDGEEDRVGRTLMADLRWRPHDRFRFGARWTIFSADPGITHYGLEQELPGGMTLASLSGRGRRYYFLFLYGVDRHLDIGARYSETLYSDRDQIRPGGTGEIDGNRLSTLTLQVDYRM